MCLTNFKVNLKICILLIYFINIKKSSKNIAIILIIKNNVKVEIGMEQLKRNRKRTYYRNYVNEKLIKNQKNRRAF